MKIFKVILSVMIIAGALAFLALALFEKSEEQKQTDKAMKAARDAKAAKAREEKQQDETLKFISEETKKIITDGNEEKE